MSDPDLLKVFKTIVPIPEEEIKHYFSYGHNKILVKLTSGYELVFIYNNPLDWQIMPVERDERINTIRRLVSVGGVPKESAAKLLIERMGTDDQI